ncbi:hypothetical protein RIF29_24911 [Crotalaria pallida]|uniref:Uncharacterized protein n=1 Tax=Crotalaria pallida TaxID=3830 RepID=A0AAN9EKK1_CROPI
MIDEDQVRWLRIKNLEGLEEQKRSDILVEAIPQFIKENVQEQVKNKWKSSFSSWKYHTLTRPEELQNSMFS